MKPIRDADGNVVGYENEPNPNRRELRSKSNGLLAWYDRNTDRTFDRTWQTSGLRGPDQKVHPRRLGIAPTGIRVTAASGRKGCSNLPR